MMVVFISDEAANTGDESSSTHLIVRSLLPVGRRGFIFTLNQCVCSSIVERMSIC